MKSLLLTGLFVLSGASFAHAQEATAAPPMTQQFLDAVQQIPQDQYSDPYLYQNHDNDQTPQTLPTPPHPTPAPHPTPPPHPGPAPHPTPPPHPGPAPHPTPPPHPGPHPGPHPIPPPHHGPIPLPPIPPPYYNDQYIDCESVNNEYEQCFFNPIGLRDVRLVQVHSSAACISGQTYGYFTNSIWVDQGCRATFFIDRW